MPDKKAKDYLLSWPNQAGSVWPHRGEMKWLRGRPAADNITCPMINQPGANQFNTQPDGLWVAINVDEHFADVIAIEDCGTSQNLYDKRSRYMPGNHSLVLKCYSTWLNEPVRTAGRGGGIKERYRIFGYKDKIATTQKYPIRFLRVLYALEPSVYRKWIINHVPTGYEYYCELGSLNSYRSPKMQAFLKQMTFEAHYYTRKHTGL